MPGAELFHGSPRDPVWDYVLSTQAARSALAGTSAPLVLVGHSHVALELDGRRRRAPPAASGRTRSSSPAPASCSTPARWASRETVIRARPWLEIDNASGRATFRRTAYPVERTQAEMRERHLPEVLAARLEHGL